ncbi:MAG TPA: hypothetical protein VGI64_22215, partial [Streptosporangiaceae bacterium]
GVLTLRFAREGEARGFGISGYDRDLSAVLQAMLGVTLQIRAIAGGADGGGQRDQHGWPDESPTGGGQAGGGRQDGGAERGGGPYRDGTQQGRGQRGDGQRGAGQPGGGQRGGPAQRGSAGQAQQDRDAVDARHDRALARGGQPGGPAAGGRASASARAAGQGSGQHLAAGLAGDADMADPADANALTGIDLIERELGGRLIGETGEP